MAEPKTLIGQLIEEIHSTEYLLDADYAKVLTYNGQGQAGFTKSYLRFLGIPAPATTVRYYKFVGHYDVVWDFIASGYASNVLYSPHWVQIEGQPKDCGFYAVYLYNSTLNISNMIENNLPAFQITQKEIGIEWSDTEFVYDGQMHCPKATATGIAAGDTCTLSLSGAAKEIGTHTAKVTGLSNPNYKLPKNVTCDFVIKDAKAGDDEKKEDPKLEDPQNPQNPQGGNGNTDPLIPPTGSNSVVMPLIAVLCAAFCAFAGAVVFANKKKVFNK